MPGISPKEYSRRLSALTLPVIRQKMYEEMKRDESELKELKIEEVKHGKMPDGTDIGEYRNKAYQRMKMLKNPLAKGKVDLVLKGQYTNSYYLPKGRNGKY